LAGVTRTVSASRRRLELVEEVIALPGRGLAIVRPRSTDLLLDEEAFEADEFLPYWAEPWPSGLALARLVTRMPVRGRSVLELGCGLALPAMAGALAGARVLATDWSADAVALAALNARRNGVELETAVFDWADRRELSRRWSFVLAADVLYEARNVDLLLSLLPRVVDDAGLVLLADPGRPHAKTFLRRAEEHWAVETTVDALAPAVALHRLRKAS
jgi:predicted nicotinamide N-methyase